jgi:hypothetical protein
VLTGPSIFFLTAWSTNILSIQTTVNDQLAPARITIRMSSPNINTRTPNPSNPSSLKPQYEIRKLEPKHAPWACAILIHSNLLHSPVWPKIYPNNITENVHRSSRAADYLVMHQINSGHSFGVFDTEYKFKREASKATDGKLYWDEKEPSVQETKGLDAESKRLLDQMDFPLVSIALSYDAFDPLDMAQMEPLIACLPAFGTVYHELEERDTRDPASWQPTAHKQVLFRNATSTRHDYEGQGIVSGMARWLMREADSRGFRGIQIEAMHDAVHYTWANPLPPYKGIVASEFRTESFVDEDGENPFEGAKQRVSKVYVELKSSV